MGQWSSLGRGVSLFWERLRAGESGLAPLDIESPYGAGLGGRMAVEGATSFTERLIVAIDTVLQEALTDAAVSDSMIQTQEIAFVAGSNFSNTSEWSKSGAFFHPIKEAKKKFGLKGEFWGLSTACATGVGIIGVAQDLIRSGQMETVVVCAYDGIDAYNYQGLVSLRALTKDTIRPYDKSRDGTLLGEGVGAIVLENAGHARRRGARCHARVCGYGIANDAYHFTAPEPSGYGMRAAMTQALTDAAMSVTEVDHVNVHGTGTRHNDHIETKAIHAVFGAHAHSVTITSNKPSIGHCMGAAGILEVIASVLTIKTGVIPPTLNFREGDPDCDLDCAFNLARNRKTEVVLSNSYGLWGCNAAILLSS